MPAGSMLAGMREIHPGADVAPLDCSKDSKDRVGNPVPAGWVASLLADRVGSTYLGGRRGKSEQGLSRL
ncbi:hypothetical protein [Mycobacterium canetti]|uniref:hypothetical protein n=1 Tax=Mycobacterium canetti TaxID=78331 RepID=UPI000304E9BB|nr:hypothetical protein [Mycobacterium canetti]